MTTIAKARKADEKKWQTSKKDLMQRMAMKNDLSSSEYVRQHSMLSGSGFKHVDQEVAAYLSQMKQQDRPAMDQIGE